jgi:hypothetical protein
MRGKPNKPSVFIYTLFALLSILLGACSAASPTATAPELSRGDAGAGAPAPALPPQEAAPGLSVANSSNSAQASAQAIERIVIKNASLTIVVPDPAVSMDHIASLADEMGGYVVSANQFQSQLQSGASVPRASIKIRVPAERLNEALSRIKAESDRDPQNESVDSQDVTSDYTDLQSRLRNLENTEAQLTKIMDAATKTEDVLSVYNQLVSIREQIEVIKGQIKYYDESAALSSISTELIANAAVRPLTIGGWQPAGVAKDAVQALINTMKFLGNAAIWILIYVLPVLVVLYIVFLLPLRLAWRALRRRQKRNKELKGKDTAISPPQTGAD